MIEPMPPAPQNVPTTATTEHRQMFMVNTVDHYAMR